MQLLVPSEMLCGSGGAGRCSPFQAPVAPAPGSRVLLRAVTWFGPVSFLRKEGIPDGKRWSSGGGRLGFI